MWLSKKLIVAVVAVLVLALAGGIAVAISDHTGTTALAADETPTPTPTTNNGSTTLLGKVASILGVDETTLENAITQAQDEVQQTALKERLDKLVADGKITQAQEDEYLAWAQSEPDTSAYRQWLEGQPDLGIGGLGRGFGLTMGICLPGLNGSTAVIDKVAEILGIDAQTVKDAFAQAQDEVQQAALKARLDKLVADGKITQAQEDEYLAWAQSEPDTSAYRQWLEAQPDLGVPGLGGRDFGGGFGMRGGMMRGGCGCAR